MQDAENKINQLTVRPEEQKRFSHSSGYYAKKLGNKLSKQEELELLTNEPQYDLLGFIRESGGKSQLIERAKLVVTAHKKS